MCLYCINNIAVHITIGGTHVIPSIQFLGIVNWKLRSPTAVFLEPCPRLVHTTRNYCYEDNHSFRRCIPVNKRKVLLLYIYLSKFVHCTKRKKLC